MTGAGALRLAATLGAILAAGCTYGPVELRITIANHVLASDGARAAFAVHAERYREATGLAAFPDGGVPLVLNDGVAVYICDTTTLRVDQVWQMDRPAAFRSGFGHWMGPWTESGLYFSVRGYTTATTDTGAFRRVEYLLGREGLDSGMTEPPLGAATSAPPRCAEAVRRAATEHPPFGEEPSRAHPR